MLVTLVRIGNLRYEKVTYYTIWVEGRPLSEFRDFQQRMEVKPNDLKELNEIRRFIQIIGRETGAEEVHFKHEGAAERLPPPYHYIETEDQDDYGLRLYCIRLSTGIVILLNGDRKTALKVNDCEKCAPHFRLANRLSKQIDKAITEGSISLNHDTREIDIDEDFELHI